MTSRKAAKNERQAAVREAAGRRRPKPRTAPMAGSPVRRSRRAALDEAARRRPERFSFEVAASGAVAVKARCVLPGRLWEVGIYDIRYRYWGYEQGRGWWIVRALDRKWLAGPFKLLRDAKDRAAAMIEHAATYGF
jgi:hypothetical protein